MRPFLCLPLSFSGLRQDVKAHPTPIVETRMSEEATAEAVDAVVVDEVEEVETVEVDAEAEETTETDNGEAEEGEKKEDKPEPSESSSEKKTDGFQKRIDELTKLRRDQERETVYWKELAQKEQVAPEPVVPGKSLADFEYDEGKYTEYLKTEAKADAAAEVDSRIQQENQARSRADFSGKEADFSKDVDDYHIVTRNQDLKITGEMVAAVQDSPDGPAVLYYLGKNPEVAERLANLSPLSMAREIGRIEATKLVKEKAQSISKAPKPVPKLVPTESKVTVDPSKMSDVQFRKWRLKQIANR